MKVTLEKMTVTEVEAEIPDKCPECGQEFTCSADDQTDPHNVYVPLRQFQLNFGSQQCAIVDGELDNWEHTDDDPAVEQHVIGYACVCGHELVVAETEYPKAAT